MTDLRTNPFRQRPAALARLPRLIRLYIFHCIIGFALAGVFTALVLWVNVANIGHLVATVEGGWFAAGIFFVLNGIVFAGVQTGIVIMTLDDDTPGGGTRAPAPAAIPVVVTTADRPGR